jgi:trans-aconitate 2-methyltransferase
MVTDAWNPSQYEKFKKERELPFYDLLQMIKPKTGMRIVDLGCGSGPLTAVAHKKFAARETLGLDSSSEMLKQAPPNVEGLRFALGDINAVELEGKYDLILSNAAFHWCADHKKLFAKLAAHLSADGQMAIQVPANEEYPTHRLAEEIAHKEPYYSAMGKSTRPCNVLSGEEYAVLMHDLGFKSQLVIYRIYLHVLPSPENVIEWVKGSLLTFYEARLGASLYESFLKDFSSRLLAVLPKRSPFPFAFKRLFIWGQFS